MTIVIEADGTRHVALAEMEAHDLGELLTQALAHDTGSIDPLLRDFAGTLYRGLEIDSDE